MKKINLLFILMVLLLASGCTRSEETPSRDFYTEVRNVDKLLLARMTISKMGMVDDMDMSKAKGEREMVAAVVDAMKIGKRCAVYSYDTYLQAYIDLSKLTPDDVSVDEKHRRIELNLPAVETEFAGRDATVREEHYRVTGLRSNISAKERAAIKEKMNRSLKDEVEHRAGFTDRLREEAERRGERFFAAMFAPAGYTVAVTYK